MTIEFRAYGDPKSQGSAKAYVIAGRARITSANTGLKFWREIVSNAAQEVAAVEATLLDGDLAAHLDFWLPRPASAPKKRRRPNVKPDLDKLTRAIFDSCSNVIWTDDARIVEFSSAKWYADEANKPGVRIVVWPL